MKWQGVLYFVILGLGIIIGVVKNKRLLTPSRYILALIIYIFLKEFSAYLLGKYTGFNLSYYKYLSSVDFILTILIFLRTPLLYREWALITVILFAGIIFYFLNIGIFQPPRNGIDSYFKLVRSFLLLICTLLLFVSIVRNIEQIEIFKSSEFWLASAVLIFYLISMFYWGIFNYNLENKEKIVKEVLRPMFEISNYILYGFLAIALYINKFSSSK